MTGFVCTSRPELIQTQRERHPDKKEAEEAEVERGGLQYESERERQRRDGDQGGREQW